jgi:hypothetical protein
LASPALKAFMRRLEPCRVLSIPRTRTGAAGAGGPLRSVLRA